MSPASIPKAGTCIFTNWPKICLAASGEEHELSSDCIAVATASSNLQPKQSIEDLQLREHAAERTSDMDNVGPEQAHEGQKSNDRTSIHGDSSEEALAPSFQADTQNLVASDQSKLLQSGADSPYSSDTLSGNAWKILSINCSMSWPSCPLYITDSKT